MNPPIGITTEREAGAGVLARSRDRATLIPDLLVDAKRVANTVFSGWHGRRKRGVGENFWQFRPYVEGENMAAIDWRRSARDDQVYVRDREWQASHTIWLWVDESPSMLFRSQTTPVSKQSRAIVIAFAMAELLARAGERVGWLGIASPVVHRHAAERFANALIAAEPQTGPPDVHAVRDFADIILISDYLADNRLGTMAFEEISNKRVRGHLVQIVDPAEDEFPYSGRVEFHDPETGRKLNFGAAQGLREDYRTLFTAHTQALADFARRLGWSHILHHTDHLASQALQALHLNLSEYPSGGASPRGPG